MKKIYADCTTLDIVVLNGNTKGKPRITIIVDQISGAITTAAISFYKPAADKNE